MRFRTLFLATLLPIPLAGCGLRPPVEPKSAVSSGWDPEPVGEAVDIEWVFPGEAVEMGSWREAVGPPVVLSPPEAPPGATDSLAVVVWNAHVGSGSLDRLLDDLSSGALTGSPVDDFVVLLQEVHRAGPDVPVVTSSARGAPAIVKCEPGVERSDVREIAERHGLGLFYAPSMRNGETLHCAPEDRGNAILSTRPLTDLVAVELPLERQRRVAVGGTIEGVTTSGTPWSLDLFSLHLSNRSKKSRFFSSFGAGRHRQAEFLARALPDREPAVLGGDLNTWYREASESAVRLLHERFPSLSALPAGGTCQAGPLSRQVDYLFFRLPGEWSARYEKHDDRYGSDHHPLVGWVTFRSAEESA